MAKILMVGAGSKVDPGYDIKINGTPFREYMSERGITVLDPVIESCHGCPDLMEKYSRQLQKRVKSGDRVVSVLQGGLLFALPSLQATQVTYPIISVPLDMVSYTAFMVPSGHAAIAGVGIDRKIEGIYETRQREKALKIGANILNFEGDGVALRGSGYLKKVEEQLAKFNIPISDDSNLVLNYDSSPLEEGINNGEICLWASAHEDLMQGRYFNDVEKMINNSTNTIQVMGDKNLVIYAAKILSLNRPDLRKTLIDMKKAKRKSYGKKRRNLETELRNMGI